MRKALLVCMLALGVSAGDDDDFEALARTAVEAKLQVGDLLREKGDLAGALKAYREAAEIWDRASARSGKPVVEIEVAEGPAIGKPGGYAGDGPWVKGGDGDVPALRKRALRAAAPQETERAVELGLRWLADHQDVDGDGRWDNDAFAKHDPADDKCDGPGHVLYDVGATGLALMPFLGAGYTDRGSAKENPYAKNVRQGLRFLMTSQDDDGTFGTRATQHWIYNHAIATHTMCEAYAMTRNPRYREPARRGLELILRSRNPYMAWRYGVRPGENDTSVTAWCVMALRSGHRAGFEIEEDAFRGALAWLDKVTDPETGATGYNMRGGRVARPEGLIDAFPPEKSQAMTAAAIFTRILCGQQKASDVIRKGADLCATMPPVWDTDGGLTDMYYWYHGTMAMYRVGGDHWRDWNRKMMAAILAHQRPPGSGSTTGSWDPVGPWARDGGRIYATAVMTLCLQVYYRFARAAEVR